MLCLMCEWKNRCTKIYQMKRQHKNWIFFVYVIRRRRGHKKKYIRNHLSAVQQITVAHHGTNRAVNSPNTLCGVYLHEQNKAQTEILEYTHTHIRAKQWSQYQFPSLLVARLRSLFFLHSTAHRMHAHSRVNERHCPSTVSYVREVYVLLAPVCISSNELIIECLSAKTL